MRIDTEFCSSLLFLQRYVRSMWNSNDKNRIPAFSLYFQYACVFRQNLSILLPSFSLFLFLSSSSSPERVEFLFCIFLESAEGTPVQKLFSQIYYVVVHSSRSDRTKRLIKGKNVSDKIYCDYIIRSERTLLYKNHLSF